MLFSARDASSIISFQVKFAFPTCFATSEGPEIISELRTLLPWCQDTPSEWGSEEYFDSFEHEDFDFDDAMGENGDQMVSEEEEMEEEEEEEEGEDEVNGIQE